MKNKSNKKIAFVKMGNFSHTNESILRELQNQFPKNEIMVIDLREDIVNTKSISNIFNAFIEYGYKIFLSKKFLVRALIQNTYIFKKVKRQINKKLVKENLLFTFQTQSQFDTSIDGVANYMYTDHTALANRTYPGYDITKELNNDKWIESEKSIYTNATMNFTMSSNITNSIVNDYNCPENKVACVYAGSNVVAKDLNQLNSERFLSKNILFVGINWERKGGPTLLKAFNKVLKTIPAANLTIVGCEPNINSTKNCNIIGKVPLAEVKQYYEKASVFCLPTTLEPFGIVYLEAMNNKLPIITTNIGAIPDFIEDGKNGYKVTPGDSDDLADKLIELLNSPNKAKEFGSYGYNIVLSKYTWNNVGNLIKKNIVKTLNKEGL